MEIEISQLIRATRRLWWIPIVSALILGLAGFGMGRSLSPQYTAVTQMLVTSQISGNGVLADSAGAGTYLSLTTSGPVLDRVILELGLDITREELSEMISTRILPGTQIIEISVSSDDSDLSADIANAISRNFVTTATDLSVGEVQRNLDDLRGQSNTLRDRVTVIDTRLAEIDTEENADDSQSQVEISQLERERLETSQTLADIDRSIRELTATLSMMSIPIVVTDFASAPEVAGGISPVLLALLGAVFGGLIGAAWIVYVAFSDRYLRAGHQIVSEPLIAAIKPRDGAKAYEVLAATLAGILPASTDQKVALVSAREDIGMSDLHASLASNNPDGAVGIEMANGVLDNAAATRIATKADAVVVVAAYDQSRIHELEELANLLKLANTHVIGTIVVPK